MANEKLVNRENLKAFRQAYDNRLEDGQLVPALTKGIESISTESGSIQEEPFILQGTGTANGSSIVDTAPIGKHLEKQGNVVCVNQKTPAKSAKTLTTTDTGLTNQYLQGNVIDTTHKYLIIFKVTSITNGTIRLRYPIIQDLYVGINYISITSPNNADIMVQIKSTDGNEASFVLPEDYLKTIDLTQWFNGDIPADLLSHPEHWSWYQNYGDYIAYNAGTLVASNGRYLECGGRNIWNEEWESGGIDDTTGQKISHSNQIRSKNYIKVIPNGTYYFRISTGSLLYAYTYDKNKQFIGRIIRQGAYDIENTAQQVPSNCHYIMFKARNSDMIQDYYNDITISLYYSTGEGYNAYYPYEQPKVYDTGTETLLKAGSVKDYKEPNGTIHRLVGSVDLGTLIWGYANERFSTVISNAVQTPSHNCLCKLYIVGDGWVSTPRVDMQMSFGTGGTLFITNSNYTDRFDFKTAMNGVYLYYELATPTTEQGTPFAENIEINDYGTMGWLDTNNAYVDIPQGCKIFYPADYVLFIDSLGQRTDIEWDASNVVSQTELESVIEFKELESTYIGAITSSEIVSGEFYKNNIAYSGGLTNAKYVVAHMSNGILYPMILTSTLLVVYSGTNWQSSSLTVSKIYYKN